MKYTIKRLLEIFLGIIFIILGIFLSLPLIPGPGSILILIGILLISPYHGKKIIEWFKIKWLYFKLNFLNKLWEKNRK